MSAKVYVWDRFVRIFHWSLVALLATSYLTGEEEYWLHPYSGYAIVTLVGLRLVWGFIGSQHARFKDFIYSPAAVIRYARSLLSGRPKHYLGHNPLAGLMILALLATLSVTAFSGMKLYAVEEGKGPLAAEFTAIPAAYADEDDRPAVKKAHHESKESEEAEEFWEEIHEGAVGFLIFLIVLHIAGVIVSSRLHRESLVKAMISGYKEEQA